MLSQGLPVEPTPFTVVAIPGVYGNTTRGDNSSNVLYTFTNNGTSFVPQGLFWGGYAQQCASGVTDTLLFCVGETESNVYSLTVYDTAQPAFVVLVHEAREFFKGTGRGGKVFTAYQPGMLFVVVGTALYVVDVSSPKDPKDKIIEDLLFPQIKDVKFSGEHIAVHAVEIDGVQENVYVYRFVDSIFKSVGQIPMNGNAGLRSFTGFPSWDIKGGVFAAVYPSLGENYYYRATIGDTISNSRNDSKRYYNSRYYHVSILMDGTIAVFNCDNSPSCQTFAVSLLQESPFDLITVYSNTDLSRNAQLAKMVSVEGYVYITLGEKRTSDMNLRVLSTANGTVWKQTVSYNFTDYMQLTFTQSNPPAQSNAVMLKMAD